MILARVAVFLLVTLACTPLSPEQERISLVGHAVPFECKFLGFLVLEGDLILKREDLENQNLGYYTGNLRCTHDNTPGFVCRVKR